MAVPTPNANRASEVIADANFGWIDVDWRGAGDDALARHHRRDRPSAHVLEPAARRARRTRMSTRPVRAALFDLDGTLVDSEIHTDTAIRVVAERHGVANFALPHTETRGRTWAYVAGS